MSKTVKCPICKKSLTSYPRQLPGDTILWCSRCSIAIHKQDCHNLAEAIKVKVLCEKRKLLDAYDELRRIYDASDERATLIEDAAREYLQETDTLGLTMSAIDAKVLLIKALGKNEKAP